MAKQITCFFFLIVILFSQILAFRATTHTDEHDVLALQGLYRALNSPPHLKAWKSDGGDPCEESWTGVECSGSSVIHINLHGLDLSGNLGFELSNLQSLKQLDLSSNNISGAIPYSLPLNVTHLNLAGNNFGENIPYSVTLMKHLRHLNLSHNALSGPLGDVFGGLENLREMDLSYNNFTGDLPTSFGSLTNLTKLFLQSNEFTGSVILLSNLPLSDLNIEHNHFSGVIPEKFQNIKNLWIGGNRFDIRANYPPWNFPFDVVPNEQNITSPPTTESNAIKSYPSHNEGRHKKKGLGAGRIVCIVGGLLLATCLALFILIRIRRSRKQLHRSLENNEGPRHSLPLSTAGDYSSSALEGSRHLSSLNSPSVMNQWHLPPVRTRILKVSKRKSFSSKCNIPISAQLYTVAELQLATNSFSEQNLLGEGSLGAVYRAEFPDGQILAVKNIIMVPLSLSEEDQVLDVIRNVSRLRHPNIVRLLGYCIEHGQHLLVYEYIRNLTLDDALHCAAYKPLSWGLRLRIALGVARALDYLHSCVPPVTHCNLKAANILLNEDFMPCICDCGLAILRPLTSNNVKFKASEMAIADSGYIAPDKIQPGTNNTKADIYAFGVLLLELLTGRKPSDSSKAREERSLVRWASSRLHDNESLIEMVDAAVKRTITSKALSRFADIVSLCIQPEKEFRPPMSEIVESLASLQQRPGLVKGAADGAEADLFDRSFRSTNTGFFSSPTLSYYSI